MKPFAFPEFKDGQLREFLQHETKQQKERNQRSIVLSVMIVLLIAVYMSFITYSMSTNFLNPKSAAQWLGYVAEENLPEYMDNTRHELTLQAPMVAEELMSDVILAMPAYLSERARDQIDSVVNEQLPFIQQTMPDILSTRLAEAFSESDPLAQIQKDPAFAKVFIDQFVGDSTARIEDALRQRDMHGVSKDMSLSLAALGSINGHLAQSELNDTPPSSKDNLEHRKLILSCLQIFEELAEEERTAQVDGNAQALSAPGASGSL